MKTLFLVLVYVACICPPHFGKITGDVDLNLMQKRPKPLRHNVKSKTTPPMVFFGAYMGDIVNDYDYLELTIESMRWNPQIDFILLNIVDNEQDSKQLLEIKNKLNVRNFFLKLITTEEFKDRVKLKLNIDVPFNYTSKNIWGRKLADYKPVFGYLFSEFISEKHEFWAYIDYDVIWGNFNAYADWFNGDYFAVFSQVWIPGGFLNVIKLKEEWSLTLAFSTDPIYLQLLKNASHHCLDEDGKQTDTAEDAAFHEHSFFGKISNIETHSNGKFKMMRLNMEQFDFLPYADPHKTKLGLWGPVRWFRGALHVVLGSYTTAPERELIMFHRPLKKQYLKDVPQRSRAKVTKDMIKYGYFLPNFIPMHTRFVCRDIPLLDNMSMYAPYTCGQQPLYNVKIESTK